MADACCQAEGLARRTLWAVLAINAVMFVVEAAAGLRGDSAGLLGDSLDMLADAGAYGTALYAVGRSPALQASLARSIGVVQLALGTGLALDVGRRLLFGSEPVSGFMIGVGIVALAANVACLVLIARRRGDGVHMRASYLCSQADVVANLGVLASGVLVLATGSRIPDLLIGAAIAAVVIRASVAILREARAAGPRVVWS